MNQSLQTLTDIVYHIPRAKGMTSTLLRALKDNEYAVLFVGSYVRVRELTNQYPEFEDRIFNISDYRQIKVRTFIPLFDVDAIHQIVAQVGLLQSRNTELETYYKDIVNILTGASL